MTKWVKSAYYRKSAPKDRKWRNKHTGKVGATPQSVLIAKRRIPAGQIEPTGRNIYGDDYVAKRKKKRKKIGKGFHYIS